MSTPVDSLVSEPAERDPHSPEVLDLLLSNHARFLERRVGSRDEPEDILQEDLRSSESATAWFLRVLRNALIDHHRREGTRSRAYERLAAESETHTGGTDQELESVACACVTALRRVDLGGLGVRGFVEETGVTASNAGVRLHRAREALRRQLARSCGTCLEHECLDCTCGACPPR